MPSFAEPFKGWLIRIGPEARKYGDPYEWCLPLSTSGEFVGVSTRPLTTAVKREAFRVAKSLGVKPYWKRLN